MIKRMLAALVIAAGFAGTASSAGLGEHEVAFSEKEVQATLDRQGPLERRYGNLVVVALRETPRITLGTPEGRAGIAARMHVALLGGPLVPVDFSGHAGIRYDDGTKAFFLETPVVDSIESAALSREAQPAARQAIGQLIATYFRSKPVYVLREDGSPQEIAARWLLRSVRIDTGRVVAILSPF
jgi:hypothetical protein